MKKIIVITLITFLVFISQIQAQKSFGFAFTNTPEKIYIIKVFEIGPAQKAGVKVNDIWLKINNIVLLGKTNQEIGNILGQVQRDEATFEFSRNGKMVNLKFSRIERDLFLERCISGDCINGNGIYRFENGKTIEGEFKNGKYIDLYKPRINVNKDSINNYLESLSIENIKKETQPQFPTSHLQPNYIADQIDTSTIDGNDVVRSQNGYRDYVELRFKAMILTLGLGLTKEVNLERAMALDNEAIRIFPNLSQAYIDRGQANWKLGNLIAAQNDFEKAKQLAPFYSKNIDKAMADVKGKASVGTDAYELRSQTNTNTNQSSSEKNDCICSKCNGTGTFRVKTIEVYYPEIVNSDGKVVGRSSYSKTIDKYEDMTCGKCLGTGKCN